MFYLKKLTPKSLKNFIKSLNILNNRKVLFMDDLKFLEKKGIKIDQEKIDEIIKIIENFNFK